MKQRMKQDIKRGADWTEKIELPGWTGNMYGVDNINININDTTLD